MRIGHRRIALVDRREDVFDPVSAGICGRGYRDALASAGVTPEQAYERVAELGEGGGAQAIAALLDLPEPPTAIIVANDEQAVGAFLAARERGLQVPRDVSIVGYSDNPTAAYLGLTTVKVPVRALGSEAARMLLGAVSDPTAAPSTIYQPTELVVRRTCGPPREE
jgi:DNA-binding LacI/PurR family transcriptional regulator